MSAIYRWFDDRIEVGALWRALFLRHIPYGAGFLYTFGFAALFVFVLQFLTGMILAMYYSPSPDHAYDSIQFIMTEVSLGSVIRGLHHWGSSIMVILVVVHMITVFVMGAYKYPRELTWMVGVGLLAVVIGFGFTGYLLPWDEKAYWATVVGTNMVATIPVVGDFLVRVIRGGSEVGAVTLSHFYAYHVLLLPAAMISLLGIHLFLVVKQGVSVPPALWEQEEQQEPVKSLAER